MNTENNAVVAASQVDQPVETAASWIECQLKDLNDQFGKDLESDRQSKEASQKRVRLRIGKMWHAIEAIRKDQARMDAFMAQAIQRGVNRPKGDENEFLIFPRMFDGWYDAGNTSVQSQDKPVKWQFSKSSQKYAGLFRFFDQNPDLVRKYGGDIAKLIEDFDGGDGIGKKINGIIAADRKANGGESRTVITEESFNRLRSLPVVSSPLARNFVLNERGFGLAFIAKSKDGRTVGIVGDARPSTAEMTRYLKALLERLGNEKITPVEDTAATDDMLEMASAASSEASARMARFGDDPSAA